MGTSTPTGTGDRALAHKDTSTHRPTVTIPKQHLTSPPSSSSSSSSFTWVLLPSLSHGCLSAPDSTASSLWLLPLARVMKPKLI
ncbi:hypothetical protein D4764_14G0009980 [Takifugu flavidus]|uniref:Uncharacterized protein n=1 Tax=Takifugu flavidus TaxID=433684 RepID=A0A5C6P6G1_9TELE|nr:hypothetical protein D4764_14G0009980 [Takifugu flavidus]